PFESASFLPRPLRSAGFHPLQRYYEPLRLPRSQSPILWLRSFSCRSPLAASREGLPACSTTPFLRAAPSHPAEPTAALEDLFTVSVRLQHLRQIGRSRFV